MFNLNENYKVLKLLSPQDVTSDITGVAGVNVEKYDDDCLVILNVGAIAGDTADVTIEVSKDNEATYEATPALTFTQIADTDDDKIAAGRVDLTNVTHIRVAVDVGGSLTQFLVGVTALVRPFIAKESLNSVAVA